MKRNFYKLKLFFVSCLLMATQFISAQDIMDVPPFDPDGNPFLAAAISKDTTDTGERANLNRIYRLERGKIYIMDFDISADFPIRLIDGGDESMRPPIIVRGSYTNGQNIKLFFSFTGDNLEHSFKNIIFTGVDLKRKYDEEFNKGLHVVGDNNTLLMEGCVMNAWAGRFLNVSGQNATIILRDNIWRNGVGIKHPFWGQQNTFFARMKKLEVTNNTWFNSGGFWLFLENDVVDEVIIEHNTLFTSAIDLFRMRDLANAKFRSNLFYGTHAYAQIESERQDNWVDSDHEYVSFFSLDTSGVDVLAKIGITEMEKNVELANNTYFSPQAYKDYWATVDGVYTPTWMNARTQSMFDNYPGLVATNNIEMDPGFTDTDMESWVVDEVINFCKKLRKGQNASTNRNYDEHVGADLLQFNWPLPESLVYSNPNMLTGGHDGLPVGDLNWFPEKRALYTGVDNVVIQKDIFISKVFPNPTTGLATIEFELKKSTDVEIVLYSINGHKIQTVTNKTLSKGIHKIELNLTERSSGLYFYTLKTGNVLETKKIILY